MSRALTYLLPALLLACAAPTPDPPPSTVRTIAVMPPGNRTGDGLLVTGTSLLEKYAFDTARTTVGDVLAAELRMQLARRGFAVVRPDVVQEATQGRAVGSPDAAVEIARHGHLTETLLVVAIEQWEPNGGTNPDFVIVALEASLVDPGTGAVLWHTHRRASPIPTPGSVTLASGYEIAAAKAAEELVGSWQAPAGP
ncbi:MAG TPA: hypothetical protein VMS22_18400 [Candidatus Eisenbacteria bacterium]|nr:hypothetical protein [Candidatus Eisenbacteria bacterium]